jgi:hypothetical protein
LVNPNVRFERQQHRDRISRHGQQARAVDFFNLLTGPQLLDITEAHTPEHRERLYPPSVTLSMFMKQALDSDRSCQRAVNAWAAQRAAEGLNVRSIGTGAYCQARQRLPLEMIQALTRQTGRMLCAQAPRAWGWRGRAVKLVDGTCISMPDTAPNQACYPQPSGQAAGVGFPLARLVGVICLSTGAVLDIALGPQRGKGNGEVGLFRGLMSALSAGDVLLGDALYCNYFIIAALQAAGVQVLLEQNGSRISRFQPGQRDHLVQWPKPKVRPTWMSAQQYRQLPEHLTVREIKVNGRVLVTTLGDARQVCKRELSRLYQQRWQVELDFRNIKTTLAMDVLRCQTPQMVHKELWAGLLAYNVIRLLMAQAAHEAGVHPRQLSFKHTVQMWSQWSVAAISDSCVQYAQFFRLIGQVVVGNRPGRIEPRARKRRPKPYQWLKVPRQKARRQIRSYGYLPNPRS